MYTYPTAIFSLCLFTGGASCEGERVPSKRARSDRPEGCRTSTCVPPPKQGQPVGQPSGGSGTTRKKSSGTKRRGKSTAADDDSVEQVPDYNTASAHIAQWRRLRESNPYRFKERTYTRGDKEFWTQTQASLWDDFYNSPDFMRNGTFVQPKAINKEELLLYRATDYRFVVDTLQKMGLLDLVCLKPGEADHAGEYCPALIRQFHCTVFFHDDPARTITWMSGTEQYSCNYIDFCDAMGFTGGRSQGFQVHSEDQYSHGNIAFCYPPEPAHAPPLISGMYYSYQVLAKVFRESLVSVPIISISCTTAALKMLEGLMAVTFSIMS